MVVVDLFVGMVLFLFYVYLFLKIVVDKRIVFLLYVIYFFGIILVGVLFVYFMFLFVDRFCVVVMFLRYKVIIIYWCVY